MIVIGKFKEFYNDDKLPSIKQSFTQYTPEQKTKVLNYLKNGNKGAIAPGKMTDVISGEVIDGELCCYSDGKYGWRSDLIYYFEKYNIELPEDFVNMVVSL